MGRANRMARVRSRTLSMLEGWEREVRRWKELLWVDGERLKAQQIVERLRASRDRHRKVDVLRIELEQALAERDAALSAEQRFHDCLSDVLRQALGPDLKRLKRYGLAPLKRRGRPSTKDAVIAEARRQATRRLRGTKGRKQREAITTTPKPQVQVKWPQT